MDPIEKAIRNALEKGDATDEAFRERVYQSIFTAFERALAKRGPLKPEELETRRARLRARIVEVESEFVPAAPAKSFDDAEIQVRPRKVGMPAIDRHDRIEPHAGEYEDSSEMSRKRRRLPRIVTIGLIALAGLVLLALLAWWMVFSGVTGGPAARAPGAPEIAGSGAPVTAVEAPDRDWISLFEPENSTNVALSRNATAEITQEDGIDFLRIRGDSQSSASFEIGRGTLEQIAGRKALFSIIGRSSEGESQIAIECDLAELGDCGRRRFELSRVETEFLFEIEVPDLNPGAAGALIVRPAMEGDGSSIDIRQIRIATAP